MYVSLGSTHLFWCTHKIRVEWRGCIVHMPAGRRHGRRAGCRCGRQRTAHTCGARCSPVANSSDAPRVGISEYRLCPCWLTTDRRMSDDRSTDRRMSIRLVGHTAMEMQTELYKLEPFTQLHNGLGASIVGHGPTTFGAARVACFTMPIQVICTHADSANYHLEHGLPAFKLGRE
eukprot:354846-Chlamydomonas_euryale.AAC.7